MVAGDAASNGIGSALAGFERWQVVGGVGAARGGDVITDFRTASDVIRIKAAMFDAALSRGPLNPGQCALDMAIGTRGQFVFHVTVGSAHRHLFRDANGADAGGAGLVIRLDAQASPTAAELLITRTLTPG